MRRRNSNDLHWKEREKCLGGWSGLGVGVGVAGREKCYLKCEGWKGLLAATGGKASNREGHTGAEKSGKAGRVPKMVRARCVCARVCGRQQHATHWPVPDLTSVQAQGPLAAKL